MRMNASSGNLSKAVRQKGQRFVVAGNLFAQAVTFICTGGLMMLFANDVLGYSPKMIASIMAFTPLIVLFRVPMVRLLRRLPMKRILLTGIVIRIGVVCALLLVPARLLSFPLYLAIILTYVASQHLAISTVWQPMLRDITTNADRGQFFARMRLAFNITTAIVTAGVTLFVGSSITEFQYKVLLAVALLGAVNQFLWLRQIPTQEQPKEVTDQENSRPVMQIVRESKLLRRPLLIIVLLQFTNMQILIIYMRQMLNIPSNYLSFFAMLILLGSSFSYLLWGKVADAIGFRPMLIGLLVTAIVVRPVLLLQLAPLPEAYGGLASLDALGLIAMGAFVLLGLFQGWLVSGAGIATTSIQHYHVRRRDSLVAMNVFSTLQFTAQAVMSLFSGFLIEDLAMPVGIRPIFNGVMYLDWVKVYMCFVVPVITLVIIWQATKLPNAKPWFGVSDFFSSIISGPVRNIYAHRLLYHEDEDRRAELARWLGAQRSPLSLDPLLELLDDPDYDVKVEAVRSLGCSGSLVAGERLLEMLKDERNARLADHLAWALGELAYEPAREALVAHLDASHPDRTRAVAARALGKLGAAEAIPPLVEVLRQETDSPHLMSSCSRALLRLEAYGQAGLVFRTLNQLSEREEFYELLYILCDWLETPSSWLLRSTTDLRISDMLSDHIEGRTALWQRHRQATIQAFRARDLEAIRGQLHQRLRALPEKGPVVSALRDTLDNSTEWRAIAVLATAWLLYHHE